MFYYTIIIFLFFFLVNGNNLSGSGLFIRFIIFSNLGILASSLFLAVHRQFLKFFLTSWMVFKMCTWKHERLLKIILGVAA